MLSGQETKSQQVSTRQQNTVHSSLGRSSVVSSCCASHCVAVHVRSDTMVPSGCLNKDIRGTSLSQFLGSTASPHAFAGRHRLTRHSFNRTILVYDSVSSTVLIPTTQSLDSCQKCVQKLTSLKKCPNIASSACTDQAFLSADIKPARRKATGGQTQKWAWITLVRTP